MGRLVALELHNFKSYKGTAKIAFSDACFTSIIGPNGAGKSNMMDAISFVLGVQSSQLRSHHLKDLVYRGRISSSLPGLSEDPSLAHVSAVYERDSGELLVLKRTISAAGSSDYKINGKNVTALQYAAALKAENILVKARNFLVFQGDIENVAAQSPRDLSRLIETISGSAELADEYNALRDSLEAAREFATQVFSRKRNLSSESKQFKEQMRERELFEAKLTEKYNLTKIIHLYRLYHNEKRHTLLVTESTALSAKIADLKARLHADTETLESLAAEYAGKSLAAKQLELELLALRKEAEAKRTAILPITAKRSSLEFKLTQAEKKISDLQRDLTTQQSTKESLALAVADGEATLAAFIDEENTLRSKLNVPPEAAAEYEDLRNQFLANSGLALEEEMSLLQSEKSTLSSAIDSSKNRQDTLEQRILDIESSISSNFLVSLAELQSKQHDLMEAKTRKVESKDRLLREIETSLRAEKDLALKVSDVSNKLDELSALQKETKKQKKLQDNVSMLKNLLKDGSIKGILQELVQCSQQRYAQALQVSLGKNADSIVVESSAVAQRCIEILKERRAGTASFIPLDSVVADQGNLNFLRSLDERARPALDLVVYEDASLERAVHYALGNTLVVDDLTFGRELKWNLGHELDNKIVALDGSIIYTSGIMSGGQDHKTKSAAWTKQEWSRLNRQKDKLVEEIANVRQQMPNTIDLNNIVEEIGLIDEELPIVLSKIASVEREISERNLEITFQRDALEVIQQTTTNQMEQIQRVDAKIMTLEGLIIKLQEKIYSEFCEKYNLSTIKEYEFFQGLSLRERSRKKAEIERRILSHKNKLVFQDESIVETEQRIVRFQATLTQMTSDLANTEIELLNAEVAFQDASSELDLLQVRLSENKKDLETISKQQKTIQATLKETESEMKGLEKNLATVEELIMRVDSDRLNMMRNCKVEGVELPLEDGFLDTITLEDENFDATTLAYLVHVDYTLLEARLRERFSAKSEAELKVSIENVERELELLAPNSKALDRLREVDQKIKDFDREFTKARQDEKRSLTRFNEVKARRTELFMSAFTHVSDKIDLVYKELTKSSTAPLGGSAYLTLEDEDEPFSAGIRYHAMPPMKRFRDMDLLSGGEKTMAALSLLFAIHSYQPSPFFVLDEIDAALDNSNVAKISDYIKSHAAPGFQFIVISLKNTLFENSDALVGIYREQRENCSKTVSLDLRAYDENPQGTIPQEAATAIA